MLPKGLTQEEAKARLKKFGLNRLPEKPPPSWFVIFFSQLKNPLVYILVGAGLVTLVLRDYSDSIIIFIAVLVNTVLGFIQEERASKAINALKKLIHPKATVIREGKTIETDAEEIVPGDVVILNTGVKIPADGKLLNANRLFASEAVLTGESVAVPKKTGDEVFLGTIVTAGRGYMQVETTGAKTQMGKIALKVQEKDEDTPLRKQLNDLSGQLTILVFSLVVVVFGVGFLTGRSLLEIFTISVALAVSSIPEGLLVALTVVLAIGMQRMAKRKGLVRHLVSAETLGGVTTICVDKTGTLTKGQMQVVDVIGKTDELSLQTIVANDFDDPLVVAAYEWGKKYQEISKNQKHERLDSIPFSPKTRFFASLNKWDSKNNMLFVNGAPEFLLDWSVVSQKQKKEILETISKLTNEGKRIVGFARKKTTTSKKSISDRDVKTGLHFVGLLAFSDPVRPGVKEALEKTKKAGIKLIVITGDYSETAEAVMKGLGIGVKKEEVMIGSTLARTNKTTLARRLFGEKRIKLFARTTPEQKLTIVEALKKKGEVVAMMGDGVNDAPALKKADIGIVVGEATDVAKETADLVLLDSSFTTVVKAIEEGRGIFDNIRKIILYLMSDAFSEIVAVILGLIMGLPLPVTAAQILWINLVSDGFPDLALTVDPKSPGIMTRSPRASSEKLVTGWMKWLIALVSGVGGVIAFGLFVYYFNTTGDYILARSVSFAALGVNSLVFVFSVRTLTTPFWKENPLKNGWLNLAVVGGLFLQFLPFASSSLREFFKIKFPGIEAISLVFLASFVVFIMIEMIKGVVRHEIK